MSDRDTVVFADHDGLFPDVVIDGFFDRDFMITNEAVETGYVGGSLVTLGSAGMPPVVFQGVRRDSERLVMAFLCRVSDGALSAAEDDELFVAIKSSFASNDLNDVRLIRINPKESGGAPGGLGVNGSTGAANDIRTNRDARIEQIFKYDGMGAWTAASPSNVEIKVRTWKPEPVMNPNSVGWSIEVSVPINKMGANGGGADWINIQNDFGFFFAVDWIVPVGGGMAAQHVFPISPAPFIGFYPGLPLADIPFGHGLISPAPGAAKGVYFMDGWQGIGRRAYNSASPNAPATPGSLGHEISATGNQIVALLGNDGTTSASGVQVEFAMAHWGLPPADPGLWSRPDGLNPSSQKIPAGGQAVNAAATNIVFGSNDWALNDTVVKYPLPTPPNPAGTQGTQKQFFKAYKHQCMWAQASALTGGVNFRQSSVRRNMDFVGLSEVERDAVVSGVGYEEPANGKADHDFILQTFCRHIVVQSVVDNIKNIEDETKSIIAGALSKKFIGKDGEPKLLHFDNQKDAKAKGSGSQYKDDLVVIWFTMGYRVTKHTVIVGGKNYPLLDNGTGSFGFVAYHKGVNDNFSWSLEGLGLGTFAPGIYGLKVPHKGEATIKVKIACEPKGPVGDASKDIPRLDPKDWVPPVRQDGPGGDNPDPRPDDPTPKPGICGLIALGIVGVPLALAATQLFA